MKDSVKTLAVLTPVIILISLFFIYPILLTFQRSTRSLTGEDIGFERYSKVLSDPAVMDAFWFSLEIAVVSVLISIVIAVITALALRDTFIGKRITLFLYQTNIAMPHIAMATIMLLLLAQTGILSSFAYQLGWIEDWSDFPLIVKGFSSVGIIISYTLKFAPFIGMAVLSVLISFSRDYEEQSASLGVGKLRTFFHVTLPAIKPAIYLSSMIVFCFAFGSYDVPAILGMRQTLPMLAYRYYNDPFSADVRYDGYAMAMIIAAITLTIAIIYLYMAFSKKNEVKR